MSRKKSFHHSKETKIKISQSNKGKHNNAGKNNGMYGKHLTLEHKIILSKANKQKIITDETRKKMSISNKNQPRGFFKIPIIERCNGMKGKHHTQETKNKWNRKGKNNGMYGKSAIKSKIGRGTWYDSPLQGKIYLRSSYELKYAKWLDENKILWYYEIQTFELSNEETYTPDFFLIKNDKFIEIKGYMYPKAKIKINKFKKEYPFDLDILYKEDLIKLGIDLK